jgi:hypothetical protein
LISDLVPCIGQYSHLASKKDHPSCSELQKTKEQGKGTHHSPRANEEKMLYQFADFFLINSLAA